MKIAGASWRDREAICLKRKESFADEGKRKRVRRGPDWGKLENRAREIEKAGFSEVAQIVGDDGGGEWPWNEIAGLSSPLLMHQLMRLCELLVFKGAKLEEFPARELVHYCLGAASEAVQGSHRKDLFPPLETDQTWKIDGASKLLAQVIYLLDHDYEAALNIAKGTSPKSYAHSVEFLFDSHMRRLANRLQALEKDAKKSGLHNQTLFCQQTLVRELAQAMVTADCGVNVGLGPLLLQKLALDKKEPLTFYRDIADLMEALKGDEALRGELEGLGQSLPYNSKDRANWLIRASVQKWNREEELSECDVVKAGLMALLTHLRQGAVGSCFATSVAIQISRWNRLQLLEDISDLFCWSMMPRETQGKAILFPFLLRFSKEGLNKELIIGPDGTVLGEGIKVWECPGIAAACAALGIKGAQLCRSMLRERTWRTEVHTLLKIYAGMAVDAQDGQGLSEEEATEIAVFAYSSHTENPVIRAWEYVLSSLVEARTTEVVEAFDMDNTSLKGRAIDSILKALIGAVRAKTGDRARLTGLFMNLLAEQLMERMQYVYDPHFEYQRASPDGHSCSGAFVLYDQSQIVEQGVVLPGALDGAKKWQEFMVKMVEAACDAMEGKRQTRAVGFKLDQFKEEMVRLAGTPEFLMVVHRHFSYENPVNQNVVEKPELIPHTLWVDQRGGDCRELEMVYFERQKWGPHRPIEPYSAQELLEKLAWWVRRQPAEYRKHLKNRKSWPLLGASPTHAFSLYPGSPTMAGLWEGKSTPREWVAKHLLPLGKRLASAGASRTERETVVNWVASFASKEVVEALKARLFVGIRRQDLRATVIEVLESKGVCKRPITRSQKDSFEGKGPHNDNRTLPEKWIKAAKGLVPESQWSAFQTEAKKLETRDCGKACLDLLKRYGVAVFDLSVELGAVPASTVSGPYDSDKIALHLDHILFDCLPESEKNEVRQNSIVIADTNWRRRGRDIHFHVQINPATGALALWAADELGQERYPLDQTHWLMGSYWPWTLWPRESILKV